MTAFRYYQHKTQQLTLPGAEFAIDGPHPGHIANLVMVVRCEIHQRQVSILQRAQVAIVVHVPNIRHAGRHDGAVAFQSRTIHQEHIAGGSVQMIFAEPRPVLRMASMTPIPAICDARRISAISRALFTLRSSSRNGVRS